MQILRSQIIGRHVFNIQGGYDMGTITDIIADMKNLHISLFVVKKFDDLKQPYYLMPDDIRQIITQRAIVDREDKLSEAEELIRLQKAIKQHFNLMSCSVQTVSGKKLGKVIDCSFDDSFFIVKKIYVSVRLWNKVFHDQLIIDRDDIVDVTAKRITVRDGFAKNRQTITNVLPAKAS